jgi:hypothetical protein
MTSIASPYPPTLFVIFSAVAGPIALALAASAIEIARRRDLSGGDLRRAGRRMTAALLSSLFFGGIWGLSLIVAFSSFVRSPQPFIIGPMLVSFVALFASGWAAVEVSGARAGLRYQGEWSRAIASEPHVAYVTWGPGREPGAAPALPHRTN